jgi:hypothetical protein
VVHSSLIQVVTMMVTTIVIMSFSSVDTCNSFRMRRRWIPICTRFSAQVGRMHPDSVNLANFLRLSRSLSPASAISVPPVVNARIFQMVHAQGATLPSWQEHAYSSSTSMRAQIPPADLSCGLSAAAAPGARLPAPALVAGVSNSSSPLPSLLSELARP